MTNRTGPVQRVTLWVSDMERSLALYRDLLGLDVVEEKTIAGPAMARMVGYETCRMRIVHLSADGTDHGWIGLYALEDAVPAPERMAPPRRDRVVYGQAAVVLQAKGLDALVRDLDAGGYEFLLRPQPYVKETDSPNMPAGRYSEAIFFDPDGVLVSLMGYEPL